MNALRRLFLLAAVATPLIASGAVGAEPNKPVPPVTAADHVLGRANAPVTVVEYASFTCSHCGEWYRDVLPTFKARFIDTGQVRLVYRNLPTEPANVAMAAAGIGKCAVPGKFFDVAAAFMNGQAALFAGGSPKVWFDGAVAVSGRTEAQIQACFADPATSTSLNAEIDGATAAGAQNTPSLFVNGVFVADHSMAGLTAAITPLLPKR